VSECKSRDKFGDFRTAWIRCPGLVMASSPRKRVCFVRFLSVEGAQEAAVTSTRRLLPSFCTSSSRKVSGLSPTYSVTSESVRCTLWQSCVKVACLCIHLRQRWTCLVHSINSLVMSDDLAKTREIVDKHYLSLSLSLLSLQFRTYPHLGCCLAAAAAAHPQASCLLPLLYEPASTPPAS
jgi:hypothetical protein